MACNKAPHMKSGQVLFSKACSLPLCYNKLLNLVPNLIAMKQILCAVV